MGDVISLWIFTVFSIFFFNFKRNTKEIVLEFYWAHWDTQAELLTFLTFSRAGFADPVMPQPWSKHTRLDYNRLL